MSILKDKKLSRKKILEDLMCDDLIHYKFDSVSSIDIKHSFIKYKHTLPNRERFV